MKKFPKLYLVPVKEEECSYWLIYNSILEAVSSNDDPVEVYEATPKRLGIYETKVSVAKKKDPPKVKKVRAKKGKG